eukprot:COSAG02_NODE_16949_length_1041_cov_0.725053_1_plen_58_part_00
MARGTSLQHLLNVQQSFDGLLELFEKETRSPGISSCNNSKHSGNVISVSAAAAVGGS